MQDNQVHHNFEVIRKKIEKTCNVWDRKQEDINLVAVSKKQNDDRINAALEYGHRLFGENRVQEAMERWSPRKGGYPDLRLHLVGPLQTNKVRDAVALFDCIETLDRPKLADALSREMRRQGKSVPCFIQVNTGDEAQKAGVRISDLDALVDYAVKTCGLDVAGLMCIPPLDEPPGMHFALLAAHARRLGLKELSMGMSGDFDKAIAAGATYIRVGSALFGARENG
mgnify:CR=1 FL=1